MTFFGYIRKIFSKNKFFSSVTKKSEILYGYDHDPDLVKIYRAQQNLQERLDILKKEKQTLEQIPKMEGFGFQDYRQITFHYPEIVVFRQQTEMIKIVSTIERFHLRKEVQRKRQAELTDLLTSIVKNLRLANAEEDLGVAEALDKKIRIYLPELEPGELKDCIYLELSIYEALKQKEQKHWQQERTGIERKRWGERLKRGWSRKIALGQNERLKVLNNLLVKKTDWVAFQRILRDKGIIKLYHFTDRRNLNSIREQGGLFSWYYCEQKSIEIARTGGNRTSRQLDKNYSLEDYVRLSFCDDHPMKFRLETEGYNLVMLEIDPEVVYWKYTCFSNMNATDSSHIHGPALEDLERINFDAARQHFVKNDSPNFKEHQAEVLVKTWVPLKYILNINNF